MIAHPRPSQGHVTQENSAMWPSYQLVEYFIPVLFVCKFHTDWIKITQDMLQTKTHISSFCFFLFFSFLRSRSSNSKVNSAVLPGFELVRDFMPFQVICNFQKDPIKATGKEAMLWTRSDTFLFCTKGQVTQKSIVQFGLNSNSSEILCLSRLSASLIKTKHAMLQTRLNMCLFLH